MKKLSKCFKSETENLRAFIECSCPYIQCGCQDIYDSYSVNSASEVGLEASINHYQVYFGDI